LATKAKQNEIFLPSGFAVFWNGVTREKFSCEEMRAAAFLAHELRPLFQMNAKLIKALQDVRNLNSLPPRRVPPKPTMLYLMQLRSLTNHQASSRRQIVIPVRTSGKDDLYPRMVKISHL
jgi:hypothetical protein